MFLLARLIGISTYIILLFGCALTLKKIKVNIKIILLLYMVTLFLMAFYYVPPEGQDLYRLIPRMHFYANLDWSYFTDFIFEGKEPLTNIYYRIIGSTGIDGLLPGITVLIVYFFCFSILLDCSERLKISRKYFAIAFFFLMARGFFGTAISNIRTLIAISIVAYGIYMEFFLNKNVFKSMLCYTIASMFHAMGMVILVIRLSYFAIERRNTIDKKALNMILMCIISLFLMNYGEKFIKVFLNKVDAYTSEGTFFYIWEYIITIIYLLTTIYVLYYYRKTRLTLIKTGFDGIVGERLYKFVCYIALVELFLCFIEYNTFFRTGFLLSILNIPIYLIIISELRRIKAIKNINIFNRNLKIIFIIILVLEASRGNLCSLKFWS